MISSISTRSIPRSSVFSTTTLLRRAFSSSTTAYTNNISGPEEHHNGVHTSAGAGNGSANTDAASRYVTFAEYRAQAKHNGPLAAVRQAYPRSLNTTIELEKAAAAAAGK